MRNSFTSIFNRPSFLDFHTFIFKFFFFYNKFDRIIMNNYFSIKLLENFWQSLNLMMMLLGL